MVLHTNSSALAHRSAEVLGLAGIFENTKNEPAGTLRRVTRIYRSGPQSIEQLDEFLDSARPVITVRDVDEDFYEIDVEVDVARPLLNKLRFEFRNHML